MRPIHAAEQLLHRHRRIFGGKIIAAGAQVDAAIAVEQSPQAMTEQTTLALHQDNVAGAQRRRIDGPQGDKLARTDRWQHAGAIEAHTDTAKTPQDVT